MKKIKFKLGKYIVSDDNPVCFVAEAGSFFNDNINLAKEYLNLSAEAKVDFFKTEILHSSDVVLKDTKDLFKYPSGKSGKNINVENYRNFIERKVMSLSSYLKLFEHAKKIKLPIIATVFDNIGVDFLKSQGAAAIKISRNNIQHKILIEYACEYFRKTFRHKLCFDLCFCVCLTFSFCSCAWTCICACLHLPR